MEVSQGVAESIGARVAELHANYYGKGPSEYQAYALPGVIVVVLEETFTPAEVTMIERGEGDPIVDIRRRFQRVMEDDFKAIVEQATGSCVRAFISDVHMEARVSVEVFLMGVGREDMAGFESDMLTGDD